MSPLFTLPLSTLSVTNDLYISVVELGGVKAGFTPIWMFMDAHSTVAGLKNQIFRSFTSNYEVRPHKIRLIFFDTHCGSVFISASLPLETRLAGYVSISNDAKLKSFLCEYALVQFQVIPVHGNELIFVIDLFTPY
jgi:hypothetical protein